MFALCIAQGLNSAETMHIEAYQQYCMERLVEPVADVCALCHPDGSLRAFHTWPGIHTEHGMLTTISWDDTVISGGSVDFMWIPNSVRVFRSTACGLSGAVSWGKLPERLEVFAAHSNRLGGGIDAALLPGALVHLDVRSNALRGEFNLKLVPSVAQVIRLSDNGLHGSIAVAEAPAGLRILHAARNNFSGNIDLVHLPAALEELDLSENRLRGSIALGTLPHFLRVLDLSSNAFEGSITLTHLPQALEILRIGSNKLSGALWVPLSAAHLCELIWKNNAFDSVDFEQEATALSPLRIATVRSTNIQRFASPLFGWFQLALQQLSRLCAFFAGVLRRQVG